MKSIFLLPSLLRLAIASPPPYFQSSDFDTGKLGPYPNHTFISRPDLVAPSLNIVKWNDSCDDGLYTFISLRGDKVDPGLGQQGPMILDSKGDLVWMNNTYGETYDFAVQRFEGEDYLTFWQGQGRKDGHSTGVYVMLDSHYKEVYRSPPSIAGDLHEFRLTPQGTALSTSYVLKTIDLRFRKGVKIWDSVFQEFDLKTNEILFSWNASDHFDVNEAWGTGPNSGFSVGDGFDFWHINSIDKDASGNYLISSRYWSTVVYIDGRNGEVLWQLGGKHNSFTDLSDGKATNFAYQHNARWNSDHTGITLFDNSARYGHPPIRDNSRGLHILLDLVNMTATLKQEYANSEKLSSISQGNIQILPSGNVLLGYGYNAAWTEFSSEGDAVCDVHIGAKEGFGSGAVQNYRTRKFEWEGRPIEKPRVRWMEEEGEVWVSWNGATEVRGWRVEGRERESGAWVEIETVEKRGFETSVGVNEGNYCYLRVVGVDGEGASIGMGNVVREIPLEDDTDDEDSADETSSSSEVFLYHGVSGDIWIFWALLASGVVVGIVCCGGFIWGHLKHRKYMALSQLAENDEA
ncbi:uncharacterized protein PAC_14953 [Phialocephala subalpina]|uniref:Arylsulfotransferase n=1 Tax=Phialocephala subalpina TaxID=576137 RepID=A0A1L7XJ55_9HELO|nr:uncharacterized protein PAC_14953 [Phialocephala subalpina]